MAALVVSRSIDQAYSETVQKRHFIGESDILLNPSLTPILTLVTKIGNRKKTTNASRVEWIEDDYLGVWDSANGTTSYTSVATNITVTDGTLFAVGDLFAVPKATSSSAAPEICRVTARTGNLLTVTRGIGAAGADTIGQTADIRILAPAFAEGAAFGTVRNTAKTVLVSYTQIFRRPVTITKSAVSQELYGPSNDRTYQRKKVLQEQMRDIESAGLWSRASESLALPGTIRTTMGLASRITTNVYNGNTTLSQGAFLSFAQTAFDEYYEGSEKLLVAAPVIISALSSWATTAERLKPGDDSLGISLKRYVTGHGDFMVTRDLNLANAPSVAAAGFGSHAFALDVDSIEFVPLSGNGQNRDTQLLEDVVKDGSDVYSDEYLTEAAWVIRHEKRHARIYGVSTFS